MPKMRQTGHHSCTQTEQCLTQRTSTGAYFVGMFSFGCAQIRRVLSMLISFLVSAYDLYRKILCIHRLSHSVQASQAEIHDMQKVFPEAVAYATVQVCPKVIPPSFYLLFDRLIMACRLLSNGASMTTTSGWTFSFENA